MAIAVQNLCIHVKDPAIFDELLRKVVQWTKDGYIHDYMEDFILLIGGCVYSPGVQLTPIVAGIPEIILGIYNTMGGVADEFSEFTECRSVSSILRAYAIKFYATKSNEIAHVITAIARDLIKTKCVGDDDQIALMTFAQTVFIVLKRADAVGLWMDSILSLANVYVSCGGALGQGQFIHEIVAAIVECCPAVLEARVILDLWSRATPVPFLSSYVSVAKAGMLPKLGPNIGPVVQQKLQAMHTMKLEDVHNAELFNIEAIMAFFRK